MTAIIGLNGLDQIYTNLNLALPRSGTCDSIADMEIKLVAYVLRYVITET